MATLLLLGVLMLAGGFFLKYPALLDAGLMVTAAGVLYTLLQVVIHPRR